jgi:hypothetical protein
MQTHRKRFERDIGSYRMPVWIETTVCYGYASKIGKCVPVVRIK